MKITLLSSDPVTHEMSVSGEIPLDFVPYSLSYDPVYRNFYVTSVDARNTVHLVSADGDNRQLFSAEAEVLSLLAGGDMKAIVYATNTGTLFVLAGDLVFEVTLTGRLVDNNVLSIQDYGVSTAIAFARQGSPMLLLTTKMTIQALCQDIPLSFPPPPIGAVGPPPSQSWFSLFTYNFCGAWPLQDVEAPVFQDMAVNPVQRFEPF